MNTWKTSTIVRGSKLRRAIITLELLRDERNLPVIHFLHNFPGSSLQDMVVHTGYDPSFLEELLDVLCQAKVVMPADTILGTRLYLNNHRLAKIKKAIQNLHR